MLPTRTSILFPHTRSHNNNNTHRSSCHRVSTFIRIYAHDLVENRLFRDVNLLQDECVGTKDCIELVPLTSKDLES